ncbi:MAG: hypothetical protein JKY93_08825 [Gammaproteobacteria bacterium]|nr:hypothetical protein [Gammaproteobacteria bacterium]
MNAQKAYVEQSFIDRTEQQLGGAFEEETMTQKDNDYRLSITSPFPLMVRKIFVFFVGFCILKRATP